MKKLLNIIKTILSYFITGLLFVSVIFIVVLLIACLAIFYSQILLIISLFCIISIIGGLIRILLSKEVVE